MMHATGTAKRLALGLGALVLLLAIASAAAIIGSARIHRGIAETMRREEGVRLSLELASAVRDQYAHQAHTIIIGDGSHLGFYAESRDTVLRLTRALRQAADRPEERSLVDRIEAESGRLDRIFRDSIVPAVLRGERQSVQEEHGRAQLVVTHIQDLTQELVSRFEAQIAQARAGADQAERRTLAVLVAILVAAPLVATAVSLAIGRSIAVPVAQLQAGAARIAEGDLDTRIEVRGAPELVSLARRWNEMTAAVRDHQEQLVRSEKLAGIGRLAAGVAHEINNPLGVILGYAKLLRKKADGALAEDLAVVEEEALRAKHIVDGLLDLSRPLPPPSEQVDLRALAEDVVARLREARLLEGVSAEVEGEASAPGHAEKLRQVLVNLVRNAGEASGPGGRVAVRLRERDGVAELTVQDSGPGIPAAARGKMFEPFFTTKPGGTGLGLAVSRAIARAHGGELAVAAAAEGGACFALTLPTAPAAARWRAAGGAKP
ncbi:integral membrane sensor signal transduction histidine kinase [Anaeromyxobacter sp. K]|uniref:sensor histidine kinase n=1 Tax=Anaeromyxobacter sp. (strain K) TaxID=447217 RepID=UPI00017BE2D5|nr:ATP-binding protein [Anaeromyxobacter sp. K]ACG71554.1 integral membrane sensor signal transduction histidine kinase [Anaeromyxobacter sp. K]